MNKYSLKEYNITYFLILAIIIHLLFFVIKKHTDVDIPKDTEVLKVQVFQKKEGNSVGGIPKSLEVENQAKKEIAKKETIKKEVVKKEIVKKEPKKEEKKESSITKSKVQSKEVVKEETRDLNSCNSLEDTATSYTNGTSGTNGEKTGEGFGSNFSFSDGVYTANSSEGIEYKIIKEIEPDYPLQALKINYKKVVKVKAKFLVGLNGNIERVEIINSHKKLGFDDEVRKALYSWKFQPIYYKNKNIKVYFVKEFVFEMRS